MLFVVERAATRAAQRSATEKHEPGLIAPDTLTRTLITRELPGGPAARPAAALPEMRELEGGINLSQTGAVPIKQN